MIKIVQFGEGNFLRTFVDLYFDTLNGEGGEYSVDIVKPIKFGTLEKFVKQNNKYHVVLRGMAGGKAVENVYPVNVLHDVIDPFTDYDKYISLATDKELKLIVSNTTEAGICFNENDDFNGFDGITYPAKLTKFLLARYNAGLGGVYMMPVELIDNNADELYKCVNKYIELWHLPCGFKKWNDEQNFYCNTLVDRIVSGYPRDEETKNHLWDLIGCKDELVSVGEPFGLWAVEDKGDIANYVKSGKYNIEVVLTKDIKYYKKRKVRVLNGSHTNLVPVGLYLGKLTVDECMNDGKIDAFINETLKNEIIPFVSSDIAATTDFARSVIERFYNPYLNHQLLSISLNSISKWKARDLPSFKDYYEKFGKIPANLTIGFSYLMAIYSGVYKSGDGKYCVDLPARTVEIKDDERYLEYFLNGGAVSDFMKDESVWGEDLTAYKGFLKAVETDIAKIKNGEVLI